MSRQKRDWAALSDQSIERYDFPDPDVIRVGDTYYLVTTTMHFMPGCELLRSADLVRWEHVTYVYDTLDSTPAQRLEGNAQAYGHGMWAASLRYHKGRFYVCFVANDTHKTYLYTAEDPVGPWEKHNIEGFYHDCSLLFDDTAEGERVYIVYGNKQIWLTELKADLSGPKPGGVHRMIVEDKGHPGLGYEGSHFYKINGRYYVFFIHSRRDRWLRVEACFSSDSPEGEFTGGDVFEDTMGYCDQGVAQGGIVDTPDGRWFALLFQDRGAAGRMPVLMPVTWQDGRPILGDNGKMPPDFIPRAKEPERPLLPLVCSDDFRRVPDGGRMLAPWWQFNHEPWLDCCHVDRAAGRYVIRLKKLCRNLAEAPNTITQRMRFPDCEAEVLVDGTGLNEGDFAGLCALQGCYSAAALTKRNGQYAVALLHRSGENAQSNAPDHAPGEILAWEPIPGPTVRFKLRADFWQMKDEAQFFYDDGGQWRPIGNAQKLYFRLDHFTGCRFGLFAFATAQSGGQAAFGAFVYPPTALTTEAED